MRILGKFIDLLMVVCIASGIGLLAHALLPTVTQQLIALAVVCTVFAVALKRWLSEITSLMNCA